MLFKPLSWPSDCDLTHKSVFLLALALLKKVGGLHGLSSYLVHQSEGWESLSFSFAPKFLAKIQNPPALDKQFQIFMISLQDIVGGNTDKMLHCLIRAVNCHYNYYYSGDKPLF